MLSTAGPSLITTKTQALSAIEACVTTYLRIAPELKDDPEILLCVENTLEKMENDPTISRQGIEALIQELLDLHGSISQTESDPENSPKCQAIERLIIFTEKSCHAMRDLVFHLYPDKEARLNAILEQQMYGWYCKKPVTCN